MFGRDSGKAVGLTVLVTLVVALGGGVALAAGDGEPTWGPRQP